LSTSQGWISSSAIHSIRSLTIRTVQKNEPEAEEAEKHKREPKSGWVKIFGSSGRQPFRKRRGIPG
jgi:hypothetical protein